MRYCVSSSIGSTPAQISRSNSDSDSPSSSSSAEDSHALPLDCVPDRTTERRGYSRTGGSVPFSHEFLDQKRLVVAHI